MIRSRLELTARPEGRAALLAMLDRAEVVVAARDQPGFLGIGVLVDLDDPDGIVVESSWSSREHFERWLDGSAGPALGSVRDLLAAEPEARLFQLVDTIS